MRWTPLAWQIFWIELCASFLLRRRVTVANRVCARACWLYGVDVARIPTNTTLHAKNTKFVFYSQPPPAVVAEQFVSTDEGGGAYGCFSPGRRSCRLVTDTFVCESSVPPSHGPPWYNQTRTVFYEKKIIRLLRLLYWTLDVRATEKKPIWKF